MVVRPHDVPAGAIGLCLVLLLTGPATRSAAAQSPGEQRAAAPAVSALTPVPPPPATGATTASAVVITPTAAAVQGPGATTPPVARLPFPNRANEALPSWLRLRAEFRERVEGFQGNGFVAGRDDAYALTRLRLNATINAGRHLSFQANVHDARVADKQVGPTTAPFRGPLDLRTAFADIGNSQARVAMRVGRQELAFGEQRLLGHLAWVNTGRNWDAARGTLRSKAFLLDVFAASLVRSLPDSFDKSGNGNRLFGAYLTTAKVVPKASVEPFVFVRRDESLRSERLALGTLTQTTAGVRVAGQLPRRLDYGIEVALQRGGLADDSIQAWAGHWQLRSSLPGKYAKRVTTEYNFASGDSTPGDGTRGTFDQLYPTGHDKLGLSDQVGWRNVHHLREGFELSPFKDTPLSVNYHSWWLAERRDGLYGANGALLARIATGAENTHIGQELDVQVTRGLTPQLQLAAGYAHVFTGAFLKQATPGASYSFPFVMATYVFLADK
jgi:hypothetical protein